MSTQRRCRVSLVVTILVTVALLVVRPAAGATPSGVDANDARTLALWDMVYPIQQWHSITQVLLCAWSVTFVAVLTTTVYLHRCVSHGACRLHPGVAWLFRFALWVTTGDRVLRWVAVHRKHHANTDRPGDPHSPVIEGYWQIQLWNVFYYFRAAARTDWIRYAGDVYRNEDRWDRLLFNHGLLGLVCGVAVLCIVLGVIGGVAAAVLHFVTYVFLLAPLINALCHHAHPSGYQHSTLPRNATTYNNWLVAVATLGEGLHHNHHWEPRAACFAHKWWELDVGWWCIRLLEVTGLASDVVRRTNGSDANTLPCDAA